MFFNNTGENSIMKASISQQQISQTAVRLGIPDVAFTQRRIARAFDLVATNKVNEGIT